MIVLQSPAIAKNVSYRPCHSPSPRGEVRDEGELNIADASPRRFHPLSFCSPSHPFQPNHACRLGLRALLPLFSQSHLCAFASLLLKFGKKTPQIPKPSQGSPRLAKPAQGYPVERGRGGGFEGVRICTPLEPIITYYRLIAPITASFPGKKIVYF